MSITEVIEREVQVVKEDEQTGNLLSNLFDETAKFIGKIIDNTIINNVETVVDESKKIRKKIWRLFR